ncbi:hypothetical protein, partial [Enterobacter hormaechei]|uniref:hypothetical protein n=1 Tax=Enterobacter hormaechei TaxID=158836 RepID=UPI0013D1F918
DIAKAAGTGTRSLHPGRLLELLDGAGDLLKLLELLLQLAQLLIRGVLNPLISHGNLSGCANGACHHDRDRQNSRQNGLTRIE